MMHFFSVLFFKNCSISASAALPFREPDPSQTCFNFLITFMLKLPIFRAGCRPPFPTAGPEPEILAFPK